MRGGTYPAFNWSHYTLYAA